MSKEIIVYDDIAKLINQFGFAGNQLSEAKLEFESTAERLWLMLYGVRLREKAEDLLEYMIEYGRVIIRDATDMTNKIELLKAQDKGSN